MGVEQRQVMLNAGTVKQTCEPAVYETVAQRVLVSPGTEHWVPARHAEHAPRYHRAQYSTPVYRRGAHHAPMQQMPHGGQLK
jgi:hypothetical protein